MGYLRGSSSIQSFESFEDGNAATVTRSLFTKRYAHFRDLMVAARKKAGITQVELSKILDRPQSFVSKYESGERRLDVIEFLEVCEALQIDPLSILKQLSALPKK